MTAMLPVYCVSPIFKDGEKKNCGKEANGGMVVVDNKIYPVCKSCWDFGYIAKQMIVKWLKKPKHKKD